MRSFRDSREQGFHVIEAGLIVVFLVVLGTVGYYAYTNVFAPKKTPETVKTTPEVSPSPGSHIAPTKEQLDRMKSVSNSF